MAYRIYADVVDDGVYANPTTWWLNIGAWEWNTRNYVAGTWSVDTNSGGVVDGTLIDYSQESLVSYLIEVAYIPYSIPALLFEYLQQDLFYLVHEWVPNLYFNLVTISNNTPGAFNSFYGEVAYSPEANLIRT